MLTLHFNNISPRVSDLSLKSSLLTYLTSLKKCNNPEDIIGIVLANLNVFGMQFKPGEVQMTKSSTISNVLQSHENVTRPLGCRNYLHSNFPGYIVFNDRLGFSPIFATLFSLSVDYVEIDVLGTLTRLGGSDSHMSDVSYDMSSASARSAKCKEMLSLAIGIPKGHPKRKLKNGEDRNRDRPRPNGTRTQAPDSGNNDVNPGVRNYSTTRPQSDPLILEFLDNKTRYTLRFKNVKLLNDFLKTRGKY